MAGKKPPPLPEPQSDSDDNDDYADNYGGDDDSDDGDGDSSRGQQVEEEGIVEDVSKLLVLNKKKLCCYWRLWFSDCLRLVPIDVSVHRHSVTCLELVHRHHHLDVLS